MTCLLMLSAQSIHAEEPFFEKLPLFSAGTDGYEIYRIPGMIVTSKGTAIAYAEARKTGSDWGDIDLFMRRSTDGGKSWSPQQLIGAIDTEVSINPVSPVKTPGKTTINNPVMIADTLTGDVHLLFCVEYERCFYSLSKDDGLSFSKPVEITDCFNQFRSDYPWKVIATGPGHGIQLKNGRLLVPVWLSLGEGRNAHSPNITATIYSDDHGKTWQRGEIALPNTPEFINPNENAVAELSDGRIIMNARNQSPDRKRLTTVSSDGISEWSPPAFHEELHEPVCMAGLLSFPDPSNSERNLLLFSNPNSSDSTRENLTVRLSRDDGKTWPVTRVLEKAGSAYSDLAVLPDGTILCCYEEIQRVTNNGRTRNFYNQITVARFNLEWLSED